MDICQKYNNPNGMRNVSSSLHTGLQFMTSKPPHHKASCSCPKNNIIHRYSEILQRHKNKLNVKPEKEIHREVVTTNFKV